MNNFTSEKIYATCFMSVAVCPLIKSSDDCVEVATCIDLLPYHISLVWCCNKVNACCNLCTIIGVEYKLGYVDTHKSMSVNFYMIHLNKKYFWQLNWNESWNHIHQIFGDCWKTVPHSSNKSQPIIIPDQGTMTKVEGSTGDLIRKACFSKRKKILD